MTMKSVATEQNDNHPMPKRSVYLMDEFDDVLSAMTPTEIIRHLDISPNSSYDENDEYFRIEGDEDNWKVTTFNDVSAISIGELKDGFSPLARAHILVSAPFDYSDAEYAAGAKEAARHSDGTPGEKAYKCNCGQIIDATESDLKQKVAEHMLREGIKAIAKHQ